MAIQIKIPKIAEPLLRKKARYKVLEGGRGSGKSYAVADSLVLTALENKHFILCGREFQKSMRDSVHTLLSERIEENRLLPYYKIAKEEITTCNGSKIIFKGIRHNINSIKSIPSITIAWLEEADSISVNSWNVIRPTVREPDSEIWMTLNPDREDDIIYKTFINNTPPSDSIVIRMNYTDNPFFPDVLERERVRDEANLNRDMYNHIWLGYCRKNSNAQIFKDKYYVEEFEPDYKFGDPIFGMDFGFSSDAFATVKVYIKDDMLYIHKEAYRHGLELDEIVTYVKNEMPDIERYTIRADSSRPDNISYLKRHGLFLIEGAEKGSGSIEDGIAFMRSFKKIVIHPDCPNVLREFELYSYKEDNRTGDVTRIIVDAYNHAIDAIRYALRPFSKSTLRDYERIIGVNKN